MQALIDKRDGLCWICREQPAAHVDHNHETGRVRGMLCFTCNAGLGNFKDRWDLLERAIIYIVNSDYEETG